MMKKKEKNDVTQREKGEKEKKDKIILEKERVRG